MASEHAEQRTASPSSCEADEWTKEVIAKISPIRKTIKVLLVATGVLVAGAGVFLGGTLIYFQTDHFKRSLLNQGQMERVWERRQWVKNGLGDPCDAIDENEGAARLNWKCNEPLDELPIIPDFVLPARNLNNGKPGKTDNNPQNRSSGRQPDPAFFPEKKNLLNSKSKEKI